MSNAGRGWSAVRAVATGLVQTALLMQSSLAIGQDAADAALPASAEPPAPYLVVLGNVQDGGFPHVGCRRPCCAAAWGALARRQLVVCLGLIDPGDRGRWLFEASPDLPQQLTRLHGLADKAVTSEAQRKVPDGIFVTHAHLGHYTGLMYLGREALGAHRVPVFAMPRMQRFLRNNGPWSQLVTLQNIELRPLRAGQATRLNARITVEPFLVPHRDEFSETVGFLIRGSSRSAVFLPDIDKWELWDRDIDELIRQVDYALLDGTFFDADELPGRNLSEIPHPLIADSLSRFAGLPEAQRNKVYFIHLNHTNPVLRQDSLQTERVLEAGCHVARTGDQFEL